MNSKVEILKGLPPYGKMYIPIPGENWSEGLPVQFTKDDGKKWVANIEYGKEGFDYINELGNHSEVLVISNGRCYIIDRNEEKSITDFGYSFNKVIEFDNKLILIGARDIVIIESSEKIKRFDDLCIDFIDNVKLENKILSGVLNDYNACDAYTKTDFNIDLTTYKLTEIKAKYNPRKKSILEAKESKKWWELWK